MSRLQSIARSVAGTLGRESWIVRHTRPIYESTLARFSRDRGIPWPINDVVYRIDPHYRHQLGEDYDAPVARFLRERVRPGAVCIDVGANVGVYVLQFAHWIGPTGRVIAFEPNPGARRVLERHVHYNGIADQVSIVPAAVGEKPGEAVLYAAGADGMSRLGAPNKAIAERVAEFRVPVTTLDHFCQVESLIPDWLLIDIEGFEIAAIAGASELIRERRNSLGIVVEMHPDAWESAGSSRAEAESLLASLGLRAVPLAGQRDPLGEHGIVFLSYLP